MDSKRNFVHEGTFILKGFTRFAFYAQKENRFITDGYSMNFLECTAELIFSDNQNFVLTTKEFIPDGSHLLYRELSIIGKITPGGELEYTWPDKWLELGGEHSDMLGQFREHTGFILSDEIIKNISKYKGSFDGNKFFAENHLVGYQEVPGGMPFFKEIVEGPIKINMMFDLEVSN